MSDTRTAILDTAERLFCRHGVRGVSVRTILREAGLNVALAHYHFGGREGLIREVLRRRIVPINEERMRLLDEAEEAARPGSPSLREVLRAFLAPIAELLDERPDLGRLLGRIQVTADDGLRWFFMSEFGDVLHRFSEAMKRTLPPGFPDLERHCRGMFMFGSVLYTLTNASDLKMMSRGRYEIPDGNRILEELLDFCVAGMTAGYPERSDSGGSEGQS